MDGMLMVKVGSMHGVKEAPMKGKQLGALQRILSFLFGTTRYVLASLAE